MHSIIRESSQSLDLFNRLNMINIHSFLMYTAPDYEH